MTTTDTRTLTAPYDSHAIPGCPRKLVLVECCPQLQVELLLQDRLQTHAHARVLSHTHVCVHARTHIERAHLGELDVASSASRNPCVVCVKAPQDQDRR